MRFYHSEVFLSRLLGFLLARHRVTVEDNQCLDHSGDVGDRGDSGDNDADGGDSGDDDADGGGADAVFDNNCSPPCKFFHQLILHQIPLPSCHISTLSCYHLFG